MTGHQGSYLATAAVLAAALVVYRLFRKPEELDEAPRPGSGFLRFGEDIRLRDLFRLAVLLEEEGAALYLRLAGLAADPDTRRLCAKLADDETEHRQLFLDRLGRWRSLSPNRASWPQFLEKVKLEGLFAGPPGVSAAEKEVAAFAILQEARSIEFYRLFEDAFPDAWRRGKLQDLIDQEKSHEAKLREAYPDIP